ncbi:hypothetical protein [Haloferula sargassicola]|uniref:Tetratricopeptide repeat protein n=1 Tax=Haloferula sargassicola TaxID=490096 RepID=A0ABP9UKL6_9BACT
MKTFVPLSAALLVAASAARAQDRFQQEAIVVYHQDKFERVWIADANKTQILYFDTERGVDSKKLAISKPQSIWLMEPAAYTAAMEDYQGRRYEKALAGFQKVREDYKKLITLPDNHSSLSAFYAMECLRKLGRLDELAKAQEEFMPADRESITRPYHKRQIEYYAMWDAVRTKSWDRLQGIASARLAEKPPGYQRAQAAYCLGLALENLQRPLEAIDAYNTAMTADSGGSEVVTAQAAEHAMKLYLADEDVKLAKRNFGTANADPDSRGMARLHEAAALAELYQMSLGNGKTLSGPLAELAKYAKKD